MCADPDAWKSSRFEYAGQQDYKKFQNCEEYQLKASTATMTMLFQHDSNRVVAVLVDGDEKQVMEYTEWREGPPGDDAFDVQALLKQYGIDQCHEQ